LRSDLGGWEETCVRSPCFSTGIKEYLRQMITIPSWAVIGIPKGLNIFLPQPGKVFTESSIILGTLPTSDGHPKSGNDMIGVMSGCGLYNPKHIFSRVFDKGQDGHHHLPW
jgi:hypothetical protein